EDQEGNESREHAKDRCRQPGLTAPGWDVTVALLEKSERKEHRRSQERGHRDETQHALRPNYECADREASGPADGAAELEEIAEQARGRDVPADLLAARDADRRTNTRDGETEQLLGGQLLVDERRKERRRNGDRRRHDQRAIRRGCEAQPEKR